MASSQVVLALEASPPSSVLDSPIVASKKGPILVSYNKKSVYFFVHLAKRHIQEHNEVEISAMGLAIATAITVSEILLRRGFALLKKIATSSVPIESKEQGRIYHKPKIQIILEKQEKAESLMAESESKTETEVFFEADHKLSTEGDHKDSTEGDHKDSTDGDHKDYTEGDNKDSTDGDQKVSTEGDHKVFNDGDQKDSSKGDHKVSTDGDSKDSADGDDKESSDGEKKAQEAE